MDVIIERHPTFVEFVNYAGISVRKNTVLRGGSILLFDDISVLKKYSLILERCVTARSTERLLVEILKEILPGVKIPLKDRKDNKITTISTHFTPESLKIIDKIISSAKIKEIFENLDVDAFIYNQKMSNVRSILFRASLCCLLYRLQELHERPSLYQRTLTLQSSENTIKKIYLKKYGDSKN